MSSPLVSIGMPVYNGGERLRRAIDCLLAQSYSNFELILSDNASTDGVTQQIVEEYATRDPRIRLTRQPRNIGAVANFLWVLTQARGEYFFWAAHDDAWSPNYIECLACRLTDSPDAVLATPTTCVTRQPDSDRGEQSPTQFVVTAAPNGDRWRTLDLFLSNNVCVWIYGIYRTAFLKQWAPELGTFPLHGGDRLWLFGLILQAAVVGDDAATFYYSDAPGKRKDRSARTRLRFLGLQVYHMVRLSRMYLPPAERLKGMRYAAWYLYRQQISRNNVVGTLVRLIKVAVLGTWFAMEAGIRRLVRRTVP